MRFRSLVYAFIAGLILQLQPAIAQPAGGANGAQKAGAAFSFAVYGDSRSMMYLPYKADEEAQLAS